MARNASAPQDKILSRRVLVNVTRDMTTATPRAVWEHEIPILQSIFGEEEVVVVEPTTLDEGYKQKASPDLLIHNKQQDAFPKPSESIGLGHVFVGSPAVEYERLVSAYGRHKEINVSMAEHVYGRLQEGRFAAVTGGAELTDLPRSQLIEMIKSYGYLYEVGYDAEKAEKEAATKQRTELMAKSQPDLVKLASEVGVTID